MAIPPSQSESSSSSIDEPQAASAPLPDANAEIRLNAPKDFVPEWILDASTRASAAGGRERGGASGADDLAASNVVRLPGWAGAETTTSYEASATLAAFSLLGQESRQQDAPDASVALQAETEDEELQLADVISAAPPWMASLAFHLVVMVILAVITLPSLLEDDIKFSLAFSETLGEQIEEETFSFEGVEDEEQAVVGSGAGAE